MHVGSRPKTTAGTVGSDAMCTSYGRGSCKKQLQKNFDHIGFILKFVFPSDDELPDYVMVMIANKKSKEQMKSDLELFLGEYCSSFCDWLHQVLDHLQRSVCTFIPISTSLGGLFLSVIIND